MGSLHSRSLVAEFRALFSSGTLSGLGEGALLERFIAQSDETAFEEILARHGPMVLGICQGWLEDPHDVEDAFQAVFLILVRKAASLRDRSSLSNWLYGVSLRVARRARIVASRRKSHERQDNQRLLTAETTEPSMPDQETLLILDEEIGRLPEKQRAAIVLCLVQGKTHETAAVELSCPIGTVKSRLASGRSKLVRRLTRRGMAPTLGPGTVLEPAHLMASAIPHELARQTLEAGLRLGISRSLRGAAVAVSVQNLIEGVIGTMMLARLRSFAIGIAAIGVFVSATTAFLLARQNRAREMPPALVLRTVPTPIARPAKLDLYGDPLPPDASMRLGTIRHRQDAPIYRIALTPDGQFVVTDGDDGQLRVWDAQDGKLIRRFAVGIDALSDFALCSDGKSIATIGISLVAGEGFVWHVVYSELATGRELSRESWKDRATTSQLALCPDRRLLLNGTTDGHLRLVNTATGALCGQVTINNELFTQSAFSADGNRVLVASNGLGKSIPSNRIRVFDVTNTRELRTLATLDVSYGQLAFSPDGNMVAFTHSLALVMWNVSSGAQSRHENAFMTDLEFSRDGHSLIGIRSPGDWIQFWSPTTPRLVNQFQTLSPLGGWISLSSDKRTVAASGGPHVLRLWDIASERERSRTDNAHEDSINSVLLTSDGKTVATASDDQTVRLWNLASGRQSRVLKHRDKVVQMWLLEDGLLITGAKHRGYCYVWDIAKEQDPVILMESSPYHHMPLAAARSEQDRSILIFSDDGSLRRWNLKERRIEDTVSFQFLTEPITLDPKVMESFSSAKLYMGGRRLAAIGIHSGLRVVDVEKRSEIGRFPGAQIVIASPDEKSFAVCTQSEHQALKRYGNLSRGMRTHHTSGTIILLDSETIHEKLRIEVPGSMVWALAFSPDGKTLAATTGWETGQVHFYEVATGRELRTIDTPAIRTQALAFSPDGSKLVCGMADTSVLVWDVGGNP
jgi:RNA polymerase sigma factor (sigma-70 family)